MPDKIIESDHLQAGDILIFHGATGVAAGQALAQALKYATVLPALISGVRGGSAGLTGNLKASHIGIVSLGGRNAEHVHATFGSIKTDNVVNYCAKYEGVMMDRVQVSFPWVYRSTSGLGGPASEVAKKWALPGAQKGGGMAYSVPAAGYSVFGSSSYGDGAKLRARIYRMMRGVQGGVPAFFGSLSSTFCSAFVIACYQAAMSETQTATLLALDAINTSPATLQGYLSSRPGWSYQGRLILSSQDI